MIDNLPLDAVIAIGSVIRGETSHFDFVCEAVAQGIKDVNLQTGIPVIFCVLTDNNLQKAIDRRIKSGITISEEDFPVNPAYGGPT